MSKIALVTGSRGFLGRHFKRALELRGYTVDGWDIAEGGDVYELFRAKHSPPHDLVVHCAAVAPHRAAIDTYPGHLTENLHLDASMFRWAIRTQQKRVLYLSSCAVYATPKTFSGVWSRFHEDQIDDLSPVFPSDDYGWLKLTGERMAKTARSKGVPVTVVRPFSGYGEDQGTDWPFGAFRERARAKQDPFEIWGDGTQVRDWIHVSDVVGGALAVVESETTEPVNLCTGVGTSMTMLAALFTRMAGYTPDVKYLTDRHPGEPYRVGLNARLRKYYWPKVTIEKGVEMAMGGYS